MTERTPTSDGGDGPPDLLERVLVPVAEEDDARTTARGLARHLPPGAALTVVTVVEKTGGAPDRASVEQREAVAEAAFAAFRDEFDEGRVDTRILYGTDVADAIFAAADDVDATAIAFTPRGGGRWARLLTGDVALDLVTETERPVLVVPDARSED